MSEKKRGKEPHRLLLGLIDAVSDLEKAVGKQDRRLDDHEARLDEIDEHLGLADGDHSEQLINAPPGDDVIHVRADINLDDSFEAVFEEGE